MSHALDRDTKILLARQICAAWESIPERVAVFVRDNTHLDPVARARIARALTTDFENLIGGEKVYLAAKAVVDEIETSIDL